MQNNNKPWISARGMYAWLITLCGIFALADTRIFGLTDQDEGSYATVARVMAQTGDFLVPKMGRHPWFEKPPLLYWLSAGFMKIFGYSEFAFRLPSVLAFCIVLVLLAIWGNKRLGKQTGTFAALIFGIAPLSMVLGRTGYMDMLLTCCLITAVIAMWETAHRPVWCLVWGAATGLAILTKGPVGLGLVGIQWLIGFNLLRKKGLKMRWMFLALVITFAVAVPWYAEIWLKYGRTFFHSFIIQQNLMRFAGGDSAHAVKQPILYLIYYVLIIGVGFFPFAAFVPGKGEVSPVNAYLRRWCWLVFCLFTLSKTKLPSYIMPMLPALALIIADSILNAKREASLARRIVIAVIALILAAGISLVACKSHNPLPIVFAIGLLGVSVPIVLRGTRPFGDDRLPIHPTAVIVLLIGLSLTFSAFDKMELKPLRDLALTPPTRTPLVIYNLPHNFPSLYFYRGEGETLMTDQTPPALEVLSRRGVGISPAGKEPEGEWSKWKIIKKAQTSSRKYELFVPTR